MAATVAFERDNFGIRDRGRNGDTACRIIAAHLSIASSITAFVSPKRNVGACSVKQFIQLGILAVLPNLQGATVGAETRGAATAASSRPHTQIALRNMRSYVMTKGSNPIALGFAGVTLLFSASATILALALAGPVAAQRVEVTSMPQAVDQPWSGSVDNLDNSLLRSAADWISNIFGLPEMQTLPAIRRIPSEKLALLSGTSNASDRLPDTAVMHQRSAHKMVAQYNYATKTIDMPVGWNGSTPAEMSVLIHLMAHHFQNVGGRKYFDCAEEQKALPYEAQERWLGLYGSSLREDFGIDQAELMLITQCMP